MTPKRSQDKNCFVAKRIDAITRRSHIGFICSRCEFPIKDHRPSTIEIPVGHVDHIVPKFFIRKFHLGDENDSENLWALCPDCHWEKTAKADSVLIAFSFFSEDALRRDELHEHVRRYVLRMGDFGIPVNSLRWALATYGLWRDRYYTTYQAGGFKRRQQSRRDFRAVHGRRRGHCNSLDDLALVSLYRLFKKAKVPDALNLVRKSRTKAPALG